MAKPSKSEAPIGIKGFDASEYTEEESLGFPPYYKLTIDSRFAAIPRQLDDSDSEFQRWVFQAEHDIVCARGPADDAEEVTVKKGGFFSTSAYAQFGNNESGRGLHSYIGIPCLFFVKGTRKTSQPTPMFEVGMMLSKASKALLDQRRRGVLPGQKVHEGIVEGSANGSREIARAE
jgi:hypothetical protein